MSRFEVQRRLVAPDLFAIGALLLFVTLRFLPGLLHGLLYAPFRDNVFIYGPLFSETARIALHGEHPFYLPSFGIGFPLFQSPHYSPFYPFYFFGLLDYGGPLQSLYTLTYLSVFHRAILALNFYVMLRCARVSPCAAFMGAALGVFAYNTEIYAGWITIAASYSWMPLLIAGSILLLRDPQRILGILLLGISAGLLALASASQAIAHALLFLVMFFAPGAVWVARTSGKKALLRLGASLVVAGVIAFGIGGVSALPVYLGVSDMIRYIGHDFVLGRAAIPWSHFNETQLALREWSAIFLNPGSVEVVGSPYIGPLGLAGIAFIVMFYPRLDSFGKFLSGTAGVIGLYALLSAFGSHFGFSYLNYHLPWINKVREAGRHLVLFVVTVVILSGLGFDQLILFLQESQWRNKPRSPTILGVSAIILFCLALATYELLFHKRIDMANATVCLTAVGVFLVGLFLGKRTLYVLAGAALIVSIASMISRPRMFPLSGSEYVRAGNPRNLETLEQLRRKLDPDDFRVDFVDPKTSPFTWGMNASYFGFDSFYNRLTPQPYKQFQMSVRLEPPRLREMMGARYVLCSSQQKPKDAEARSLFGINGYTLFENPSYMRRVTLTHFLAGTNEGAAQLIAGLTHGFDFQNSVYLERSDLGQLPASFLHQEQAATSFIGDRLQLIRESTNHVRVETDLSRPAVVVLNEWFTPAWKATINGSLTKSLRANQWQVGALVPSGKNTVEFEYRPGLTVNLLRLNRLTWVLLAVFGLILLARPRFLMRAPVFPREVSR